MASELLEAEALKGEESSSEEMTHLTKTDDIVDLP